MKRFRNPKVQGQLRHLLTALGPVLALLIALYQTVDDPSALLLSLVSPSNWPAVVGFAMAVVGFVTSWTAPEKSQ